MTLRIPFALALTIACATPVLADPRITTRSYEESSIVVVHGRAGIESTIAFAPEERIENIAIGNSAAWQVTPNKRANLLFVKPAGARARTNMTVVTDQRTYLFDLVSGAAGTPPVYMLRFSYPRPPEPVAPVAPVVPEGAVTVAQVAPEAAAPRKIADLNFAWRTHGDKQLLPSRSFDDGQSTFLEWPEAATLPAILIREANGIEGPVNFTVQGAYIVVEGVPPLLILRAGKQMATLAPLSRSAPSTTTASVQQ